MQRNAIRGDDFLHSMMKSDRRWEHFELLQSMEWHYKAWPKKKKPSSHDIRLKQALFWDAERCILVEYSPQEETINAAHCLHHSRDLLRTARKMYMEEKNHPAIWQHSAPHHSPVHIQNSEERLGTLSTSTLDSVPSSLGLPSVHLRSTSDGRQALWNQWGNPGSHPCCLQIP